MAASQKSHNTTRTVSQDLLNKELVIRFPKTAQLCDFLNCYLEKAVAIFIGKQAFELFLSFTGVEKGRRIKFRRGSLDSRLVENAD